MEVATPHGPARVHLREHSEPVGMLMLGHGAGGGVSAPDLVAAADAAGAAGFTVALVEQPYRVAGRRNVAPTPQLDAAWIAVADAVREDGVALVVGGRSSGARVACRTAQRTGAAAVLCLAFPLHPPGKGDDPAKSRLPELDGVGVPTLVIQGERDPFGMPPPGPRRTIVRVPGTHSLRNPSAIRAAVDDWLAGLALASA